MSNKFRRIIGFLVLICMLAANVGGSSEVHGYAHEAGGSGVLSTEGTAPADDTDGEKAGGAETGVVNTGSAETGSANTKDTDSVDMGNADTDSVDTDNTETDSAYNDGVDTDDAHTDSAYNDSVGTDNADADRAYSDSVDAANADTGQTHTGEASDMDDLQCTEAETVESSGMADSEKLRIIGFEGFDVYGGVPYKTINISAINGKRTYLVLPSAITLVTEYTDQKAGDASTPAQGAKRRETVSAHWVCENWDTQGMDSYRFILDIDTESYELCETLTEALGNQTAELPYIDVHVKQTVMTRSYNPDAEIPSTIIVNGGLIYIPGTTTSTYDFTINGKRAFCMQHPIPSAVDGQVLTPSIYENADIQKVLYYGYGGVKPYDGFTSEAAGIVMTSLALSYFYMGDYAFAPTWAGGAYGSYSQSLGFDRFLDYIKAQPYDSGITAMEFSKSNVQAYVDSGVQRTENITFQYAAGEYITLQLPSGVTLVNTTRNTQSSSTATIYGGDSFYLKAPLSMRGTWSSGAVTGSKGRFAPIICLTGPSTQDVGYGEWVEDKDHTVSLSVTWTSTRDAQILKRDADTGNALSGARLRLSDSAGKVLDTWTSTGEPHKIPALEIGQSYILTELTAPAGYLLAAPVTFTVSAGDGPLSITMDNRPTDYEFHKLDIVSKGMLSGAVLKVSEKKTGKVVAQWQSDQSGFHVRRLVPDTAYIYSEVTPAPGYVTADSIEFVVSKEAGTQTVTMVDDYTKIEILKLDVVKKTPVKGARLQLLDDGGNALDTWVTDGDPHVIHKLAVGKTYTLRELEPAVGYVTAPDVQFTVRDTSEVQSIEMLDDFTKVDFLKTDLTTGKPVAGARLAVYPADAEGKAITDQCCATWTSTEEPHRIEYLPMGNYILRETKGPGKDGYVTAEDVAFTIGDSGAVVRVEMKDDHTRLEVNKTDTVTGKPVAGAKLAIYPLDSKGQPDTEHCLESWVTDGKSHLIEYIPVGKYILRELEPPVKDGYVTSMDLEFTVEDQSDVLKIEMKDAYSITKIYKVDSETKECIAGAVLKLVDSEGNVIDEWISEDKPREILRLNVGEQYELIETTPPDGYTTAPNVKFVVRDTAKAQEIVMEDERTRIIIDKKDKEQGAYLAGAHLKLVDPEGNMVDEWISTEEGHAISMLVVGRKYTLKETEPPVGYATAADIEFVVADSQDIQQLSMADGCTKLSFEKVDASTKALISGAKLQLKDKSGDVVASWTSDEDKGYYVEKLGVGMEYVIEEVSAPENYEPMEAMVFTVKDTSELQTILLRDEPIAVAEKAAISPKTGDDMPLALVAAVAGVSFAGAAILGWRLKKRPHEK